MQNEIKSPKAGSVSKVLVREERDPGKFQPARNDQPATQPRYAYELIRLPKNLLVGEPIGLEGLA